MPQKWSELVETDSYKAETPDQQEVTRNKFFDEQIAPTVSPDRMSTVKADWDSRTLPRPAKAAPGVAQPDSNVAAPGSLQRPTSQAEATPRQNLARPVKGDEGFVEGLKDFGRGTVAGVVQNIPDAAAGLADYIDTPDFDEAGTRTGDEGGMSRWARGINQQGERLGAGWQQSEFGRAMQERDAFSVRGSAYEAGKNLPLSFGPGLAGAATGFMLGGPVGAAGGYVAGSLLGLPLFFGHQAKDTYDKVYEDTVLANPDMTDEQAHTEAMKAGGLTGSVEAGGELVADLVGAKLFKVLPSMAKKDLAKAATRGFQGVVPMAKELSKVLGVEVATELGQGAAQAEIEKAYGSGDGATWDEQKKVIMPTILMTLVGGGAGLGMSANQRYRTAKVLQNPNLPDEQRVKAVEQIAGVLAQEDPELGKMFYANGIDQIDAGLPVIAQDDRFYLDYKPMDQRAEDKRMAAGDFTGGEAEQESPGKPETPAQPDSQEMDAFGDPVEQPGTDVPIVDVEAAATAAAANPVNPPEEEPEISSQVRGVMLSGIKADRKVAQMELKAAQAAQDEEAIAEAEAELQALTVNLKRVTNSKSPIPTPKQQRESDEKTAAWGAKDTPEETPKTVLQNRDRATAASIAQMQEIAAAPDYDRAGFSRDFANGAPVVEPGAEIPAERMGKTDTATTAEGRKIPVQYAVVEADQLLASNQVDGTPNPDYEAGADGMSRSIAGNGRAAGIQRGFEDGTTDEYVEAMAADASLHGIPEDVIRQMEKPMLVRIMPQEEVTPNIGDESNVRTTAGLNPKEQAQQDTRRIDISAVELDAKGEPTAAAVEQFVASMPTTEASELMDGNKPNRKAYERLGNAVFAQAYESEEMLRIAAEATDPEVKNVMTAMKLAAGKVAKLADHGDFDIRGLLTEAAEIAINAQRADEKLSDYIQQNDMGRSPEVAPILEMMVENGRSSKAMAENLSNLADVFYTEANLPEEDMFGEVEKRSPKQLMEQVYGEQEEGQAEGADPDAGNEEAAPVEGGPEPTQGSDERETDAEVESSPEETQEADYNKPQLVSPSRADELRARLKKKLQDQDNGVSENTGIRIDPEMIAIGTELAVFHIENGAESFSAFVSKMASDLGVELDVLKPYLRSWYNGARDMMEDAGIDVSRMDSPETVRDQVKDLIEGKALPEPEAADPEPYHVAFPDGSDTGRTAWMQIEKTDDGYEARAQLERVGNAGFSSMMRSATYDGSKRQALEWMIDFLDNKISYQHQSKNEKTLANKVRKWANEQLAGLPEADEFNLASETEAEREGREKEGREKAEAADEKARKADEKAQADLEVDSFNLSGSDRPADVMASQGQGGLFDAPAVTTQKEVVTDEVASKWRDNRAFVKGAIEQIVEQSPGNVAKVKAAIERGAADGAIIKAAGINAHSKAKVDGGTIPANVRIKGKTIVITDTRTDEKTKLVVSGKDLASRLRQIYAPDSEVFGLEIVDGRNESGLLDVTLDESQAVSAQRAAEKTKEMSKNELFKILMATGAKPKDATEEAMRQQVAILVSAVDQMRLYDSLETWDEAISADGSKEYKELLTQAANIIRPAGAKTRTAEGFTHSTGPLFAQFGDKIGMARKNPEQQAAEDQKLADMKKSGEREKAEMDRLNKVIDDFMVPERGPEVTGWWDQASPEERGHFVDVLGHASHKDRAKWIKKGFTDMPAEATTGAAQYLVTFWDEFKVDPAAFVKSHTLPTRGESLARGLPELEAINDAVERGILVNELPDKAVAKNTTLVGDETAPEHARNEGRALDDNRKFAPLYKNTETAPEDVLSDEELGKVRLLEMDEAEFTKIIDSRASLFESPDGLTRLEDKAKKVDPLTAPEPTKIDAKTWELKPREEAWAEFQNNFKGWETPKGGERVLVKKLNDNEYVITSNYNNRYHDEPQLMWDEYVNGRKPEKWSREIKVKKTRGTPAAKKKAAYEDAMMEAKAMWLEIDADIMFKDKLVDSAIDQREAKETRQENSTKTILSVFDYTGSWGRPFADAGYNVIPLDIQNGHDIFDLNHEYLSEVLGIEGEIYGILAACPCTDFTSAGAKHWKTRIDKKTGEEIIGKDVDGRTEASKDLVMATLDMIENFDPAFWVLENPVGRIEKLTGLPKANMSFEPHNVGGHAYTKRTMLWGKFNNDLPVHPVDPVMGSKMHNKFGGKSMATKNARSKTPEGFAYSFFAANNHADLSPEMRLHREMPEIAGAISEALKAGLNEEQIRTAAQYDYEDLKPDTARTELLDAVDKFKNPPKPKPKANRKAKPKKLPLNARLSNYFVPGRVVKSYAGHDRVISLDLKDNQMWSVTVIAVNKDGSAIKGEQERTHSTIPSERDLKAWEKENPVPVAGKEGKAKPGGEYGLNGEWYKGGQFMPASARTVKGKWKFEASEKGGAGKTLIAPGEYAVPPPGHVGIFNRVREFIGMSASDTMNAVTPHSDEVIEKNYGLKRRNADIEAYNAGKRFVNIETNEYYDHSAVEDIEAKANEAATSPTNDRAEPTEAQKEAGNYKMGHINVAGLDISVENPKGSERKGTDEDGTAWAHTMQSHYGYIKKTDGADGDHVDVFVGDAVESDRVFVVDQVDGEGVFDEHKVMVGFTGLDEAIGAYKENYDPSWVVGPVADISVDDFKAWLEAGNTKKPIADEFDTYQTPERPDTDPALIAAANQVTFTEEFEDADGNTIEVEQKVPVALRQMDKRLGILDSLLGCLQ